MPPIRNTRELKEKAQYNNFLHEGREPYRTVSTFTQKLMNLQDKLRRVPMESRLEKQVNKYAQDLMTLQTHDSPITSDEALSTAITDVTVDLPYFLRNKVPGGEEKTGYQLLAEAGEKYGAFTRQELNEALDLVGDTLGVNLSWGDPERERKQAEKDAENERKAREEELQRRQEEAERQAIIDNQANIALLDKLNEYQTEGYMPQREVPEEEKLDQKLVDYLNRENFRYFFNKLGVNISQPGDKVPETGGTPRMFIMDEKDPTKLRTLEEAKVSTGSKEFWELAQQGKLFAYPAGSREPVQMQVKVQMKGGGPRLSFSAPLSKTEEKFKFAEKAPEPKQLPQEVPRPGFFARLMHSLNSNWYKQEHEAYDKNQTERRRIEEENRKQQEDYDRRVREAQEANSKLAQRMAAGAENAYGKSRTPGKLAQEGVAYKAASDERERMRRQEALNKAVQSAEKKADHVETGVKNMISVFGPEPKPLPNHSSEIYHPDSFSMLKPVTLPKDMKIGQQQVDDRLFANLAFHANLRSEGTLQKYREQKGKNAEQVIMAEGLTEAETKDVIYRVSAGFTYSDTFDASMRTNYDITYFEREIKPARERADKALQEYRKGNKAPLAEIIANAADYVAKGAKNDGAGGPSDMTDAKLTGELLDLLYQDPELKAEAEKKGLTEKTIRACRGMDDLRELRESSLKAEKELAKAHAEHRELTQEEKQEHLHAIFKYRTADAMLKQSVKNSNNPQLNTITKTLQERADATSAMEVTGKPMPEGMKPISAKVAGDISQFHYHNKLLKTPAVLKELEDNREKEFLAETEGEEPEPTNLDKLADMTIKGMGLDKLDTAALADTLVDERGPKGPELLMEQGKLMAKQQEKQQIQEEYQRKLNTAMVMDPHEHVSGQ